MNLSGTFRKNTRLAVMVGPLVTTGGLAISSLLNLAALLAWVRLLAPAEFGTLALVNSAGLMAYALAFEWLRIAGAQSLYDVVLDDVAPARLGACIRVGTIALLLLSVLALGATLIGIAPPGLNPRWNIAALLFAVSEMLLASTTLVARLRLHAWTCALVMVGRSAAAFVIGLTLVELGFGAAGVILGIVVAQGIVTTVAIFSEPVWRSALARPASRKDEVELVRLGAPLIAGSVLALAAGIADRSIVAAQLGLAAAGAFTAPAELVAKTLGFGMMAINLSAYPLLVRAQDRRDALRRNGAILVAASLPIFAVLVFFADPLSALLLGERYPLAPRLLPWLAGAALMRLLVTFHFGVAVQLSRRMAWLLPPPALALVILVVAAPAAIRTAGLEGMTMLLCAAQAASLLLAAGIARYVTR